ncbi:MAG: hypothetical protein F6J98_15015 [Moorea sp. SIO4G2]|nr:hypothetical protein [Moorena sp. SIO4G2]
MVSTATIRQSRRDEAFASALPTASASAKSERFHSLGAIDLWSSYANAFYDESTSPN